MGDVAEVFEPEVFGLGLASGCVGLGPWLLELPAPVSSPLAEPGWAGSADGEEGEAAPEGDPAAEPPLELAPPVPPAPPPAPAIATPPTMSAPLAIAAINIEVLRMMRLPFCSVGGRFTAVPIQYGVKGRSAEAFQA